MALRTIPFRDIEDKTENMYEAVAAMSSQAKRILYERVVDATLKDAENEEFGVFDEVEEEPKKSHRIDTIDKLKSIYSTFPIFLSSCAYFSCFA